MIRSRALYGAGPGFHFPETFSLFDESIYLIKFYLLVSPLLVRILASALIVIF